MSNDNFDYDKFSRVLNDANEQPIKNMDKGMAKKLGSFAKRKLTTDNVKKGETLGNLYTGKKLVSGVGVAIGLAGVGSAIGLMKGASRDLQGNDAATLNALDNLTVASRTKNTAPRVSARGVAPSVMAGGHITGEKADDLGATGDMVFGMHNKRHG